MSVEISQETELNLVSFSKNHYSGREIFTLAAPAINGVCLNQVML